MVSGLRDVVSGEVFEPWVNLEFQHSNLGFGNSMFEPWINLGFGGGPALYSGEVFEP